MHTTRFNVRAAVPSPGPGKGASDPLRGVLLLLCVLVTFGVYTLPAHGQSSFPGASSSPSLNLRVYPSDFWGPRVGPGVGLGLVGHNLVRSGDQWLLTGAPALHEQVATLSFATANPRRISKYVLVDDRILHTDRDWFGPAGSDDRITLKRSAFRARVRAGQTLFAQRLLLQPHLTLSSHDVAKVDLPTSTTVDLVGLGPASFPRGAETGLRVGGAVQLDTRNRRVLTSRGLLLQATWDRYIAIDGSALHFDQVDFDAYGYIPIWGLHRVVLRGSTTLTNALNSTPVPAYMLPTVGGTGVPGWARSRFVGPDRFIGSLLYRFPLRQYGNLAVIEGHLGVHAAGVYGDLGDQFTTSVSYDENVPLRDGSIPLHPSASAGIRFVAPFREHTSLEFAIGLSPEGVSAARVSFVRRLQSIRPPHHASEPLR